VRIRREGQGVVAVLSAVVVAITLAACGGGDDSSRTETVTVTTETSPTTAPPPVTVTEDPATIVLQLSDLPPGWTELGAGEGFGEEEVCGFAIADGLVARAETNFQDSNGVEGVGSEAGVTATEGDAESLFGVAKDVLGTCTQWRPPGESGATTWRVEPADVEPLGDESVAVQLQTGNGPGDFRAVATYVRVKEYIAGVADTRSASDAGTIDEQIAETERLARIVVDRMGEPAG